LFPLKIKLGHYFPFNLIIFFTKSSSWLVLSNSNMTDLPWMKHISKALLRLTYLRFWIYLSISNCQIFAYCLFYYSLYSAIERWEAGSLKCELINTNLSLMIDKYPDLTVNVLMSFTFLNYNYLFSIIFTYLFWLPFNDIFGASQDRILAPSNSSFLTKYIKALFSPI